MASVGLQSQMRRTHQQEQGSCSKVVHVLQCPESWRDTRPAPLPLPLPLPVRLRVCPFRCKMGIAPASAPARTPAPCAAPALVLNAEARGTSSSLLEAGRGAHFTKANSVLQRAVTALALAPWLRMCQLERCTSHVNRSQRHTAPGGLPHDHAVPVHQPCPRLRWRSRLAQ